MNRSNQSEKADLATRRDLTVKVNNGKYFIVNNHILVMNNI